MATLTGPQLEVIALLAHGKDVNEIAFISKGTQASVNQHIRDACVALGANDRVHLMAVAALSGLLHIPALAAARAEAEQYHAELIRANEAAVTARNAQTLVERKLTTVRNDLAAEIERREHAERITEAATAPGDVEQLRAQIDQAERAVADAQNGKALAERQADAARKAMNAEVDKRKTLEKRLADLQTRADATDPALRKELAQARAENAAYRDRVDELRVRADRYEATGQPPRTPIDANDPGGVTVAWVLGQLANRAGQAREVARRSGVAADLSSVRLARELDDVAELLADRWRRSQAARTPVGAR